MRISPLMVGALTLCSLSLIAAGRDTHLVSALSSARPAAAATAPVVVSVTESSNVASGASQAARPDFTQDEKHTGTANNGGHGKPTEDSTTAAAGAGTHGAAAPAASGTTKFTNAGGASNFTSPSAGSVKGTEAPSLQVEYRTGPTTMLYTDTLPAGIIRTVKVIRSVKQGNHVMVTTSFTRYQRPWKPLPLSWIEIPSLRLRARLVEGITQHAMARGPGHFPGTALPGEVGNCGIAAHSNVPGCDFFHGLHRLRSGSHIYLDTTAGQTCYTVVDMHIVRPSEVRDLLPTTYRRLTLVTCTLPNASRRLIVVAVAPQEPADIQGQELASAPTSLPQAGAALPQARHYVSTTPAGTHTSIRTSRTIRYYRVRERDGRIRYYRVIRTTRTVSHY